MRGLLLTEFSERTGNDLAILQRHALQHLFELAGDVQLSSARRTIYEVFLEAGAFHGRKLSCNITVDNRMLFYVRMVHGHSFTRSLKVCLSFIPHFLEISRT